MYRIGLPFWRNAAIHGDLLRLHIARVQRHMVAAQ